MFYEIRFPNIFVKFTGKPMCWNHFIINLQAFTENSRTAASGTNQMYLGRWHEQLGSICSGTWICTEHWLYCKKQVIYPAAIILQEMLSNIRTPLPPTLISHQETLRLWKFPACHVIWTIFIGCTWCNLLYRRIFINMAAWIQLTNMRNTADQPASEWKWNA